MAASLSRAPWPRSAVGSLGSLALQNALYDAVDRSAAPYTAWEYVVIASRLQLDSLTLTSRHRMTSVCHPPARQGSSATRPRRRPRTSTCRNLRRTTQRPTRPSRPRAWRPLLLPPAAAASRSRRTRSTAYTTWTTRSVCGPTTWRACFIRARCRWLRNTCTALMQSRLTASASAVSCSRRASSPSSTSTAACGSSPKSATTCRCVPTRA